MKIKNIILTFLLGVFTVARSGAADQGYMGSGYTKEDLDAMGVNTQHLFVFTEERATYNGRTFSIDIPIDSLIEIFGPCERILYGKDYNTGYNRYFWDEIGFTALVSPEKEVMEFNLHWDYLPKEKEYDYDDPDPADVPAKFFKGKILFVDNGSVNRYHHSYHKLYFFDYTAFEDNPFFSYRVKIALETGQMHEFGMQYDVYTNPNFINIF